MFSKLLGGKPKEEESKDEGQKPEEAEIPADFMNLALGEVSESSDSDNPGDDESLSLMGDGDDGENSLDSGHSFADEHSIASLAYNDPELKKPSVDFSVEYWDTDPGIAARYMYRKDDDIYREAVGKTYTLNLYPFVPSKEDGVYRIPMMRLSRIIKAVQVRRVVLSDEINATAMEVRKYDDLNALCDKKLSAKETRTKALEEEMDHAKQYDDSKPTSRFSAALGTKIAWAAISTFLQKEFKHLEFLENHPDKVKAGKENDSVLDKAHKKDEHDAHTDLLTIGEVKKAWELMQLWLLVRGLEARARCGQKTYPNPSRDLMRMGSGSSFSSGVSEMLSGRSSRNSARGEGEEETPAERRNRMRVALTHKNAHILLTMIPSSHLKNQYASWGDVVKWTGADGKSIYHVAHAVAEMLEQQPLCDLMSPITLNDYAAALKELKKDESTNLLIAHACTRVTDDLGDYLEELLGPALREYIHWCPELEKLRKDRMKRLGMKYVSHDEGEMDVDIHGAVRVIPNADDVIDTDLLHGYVARLDVKMVKPAIQKKVDDIMERKREKQKELVCVQQFGYEQTAPYLQRIFRGVLGRMERNRVRTDCVYEAQHAAATTIQMLVKMNQTAANFAEEIAAALVDMHSRQVIGIQKNVRRFIVYVKYQRIAKARHKKFIHHTVARFQAMVRGYFARKKTSALQDSYKEVREKEVKKWAVVNIQKLARGYIARNTMVKSMKIRNSLSKDVLGMAEKFLKKGNLWDFLREVDGKFRRLNNELVEIEQREDEMATTFVDKVIKERQGDFDGAWDEFGRVLTADENKREDGGTQEVALTALHPNGTKALARKKGGGGGGGRGFDEGDGASIATISTKGTGLAKKLNKKIKKRNLKENESAVPGPLLRRAVSATVKKGLEAETERLRNGESLSEKLVENIRSAYGPGSESFGGSGGGGGETHRKSPKKGKKKSGGGIGKGGGGIGKGKGGGGGGGSGASVAASLEASLASKERKSLTFNPNDEVVIKTGINNARANWVQSAPKAAGFKGRGRPGEDQSRTLPGQSYLLDIPNGVDDDVERLMRAAALRMYKPEFFHGDEDEAYRMYLQLPQGLSKIRYESEAWRACQKYINALRNKGFKMIRDMLPFSKFGMFCRGVGVPPDLIEKSSEIVRELLKMENALKGTGHKASMDQTEDIMEGVGKVTNALDAKFIIKKKREENARYGIDDDNEYEDILAEESVLEQEMKLLKPKEYDTTLPSRFLDNLIERGEWNNLHAKVDDLLLHAAFMIVPYTRLDEASGEELVTPLGHYAFREFVAALQRMDTDKARREATRSRFRAALLMSTPFALSLKADGVQTVQELVKVNLPDIEGMTDVYMEQVESLLATCVGEAAEAKIAPTIKDHKKPNDENQPFAVPMSFDPKFQLSPFDPYGRPPRLGPLRDNIKRKSKKERDRLDREKEAKSQIPPGLWNYQAPPTAAQEKPALWGFNPTGSSGLAQPKDKLKSQSKASTVATPSVAAGASMSTAASMMAEIKKAEEDAKPKPPTPDPLLSPIQLKNRFAQTKRAKKNMDEFLKRKAMNPKKHDFEAYVRGGFQRPYVCGVPGCGQAFSRVYTLRVHERSHALYSHYHKYKRDAMLGFDPNVVDMAQDEKVRAAHQHQLPSVAQSMVDSVRWSASQRMDSLASGFDFNESSSSWRRPPSTGNQRLSPLARPPSVGAGSTVVHPATGRFTAPGSATLTLDGLDYSEFPHEPPPASAPLEPEEIPRTNDDLFLASMSLDGSLTGLNHEQNGQMHMHGMRPSTGSQLLEMGGLDSVSAASFGAGVHAGFADGSTYPNPFDEPLPGLEANAAQPYPQTRFEPVTVASSVP